MAERLFAPVLEAEVEEEKNLRDNRIVRVTLLESSDRAAIELSWNVGGPKGRETRQVLKRGASATLPVGRAQSYFGYFTIPKDLETLKDERERSAQISLFYDMKARALLAWGGYPLPRNHSKDGMAPVGPHRFPDVSVTVIEQDGTEWEPIRLHQLYEIGEFDALTFEKPVDPAEVLSEKQQLEKELAELKGQMAVVLATMTANAQRSAPRPQERPQEKG